MHILATYTQKEVDNYPKSLYNKVCMTFTYAHLTVNFLSKWPLSTLSMHLWISFRSYVDRETYPQKLEITSQLCYNRSD